MVLLFKKVPIQPAKALNLLCLALFTLLASCASQPAKEVKPEKAIVWPSPPEAARISYVRSISNPDDIGANEGFFKKISSFILGADPDDIIKPYGLASDSKGRVLVADAAFKRVHIYDLQEKEYSFIEEAGEAELDSPIGVAVDSDDNIYVTDSTVGKVYAFDRKGKLRFAVEGLSRPTGIAVNRASGELLVTDTGAHDIKVYDLKGKFVKTLGSRGDGAGQFNYPVDVFTDKNGYIYVADSMNFRLQIFNRSGVFSSMFGRQGDGTGDFGRPKGVCVDADGNIYIADALFDTVQIFDRSGNFLLNFGKLGREPGTFWLPAGLYADGNRIYVADSYNKRIQVFQYHSIKGN